MSETATVLKFPSPPPRPAKSVTEVMTAYDLTAAQMMEKCAAGLKMLAEAHPDTRIGFALMAQANRLIADSGALRLDALGRERI